MIDRCIVCYCDKKTCTCADEVESMRKYIEDRKGNLGPRRDIATWAVAKELHDIGEVLQAIRLEIRSSNG
jgi:hypothetical protein